MGVAAKLGDTKFSTLQEAINAAQAGENVIALLDDVEENVTIGQKAGVNITIDGNEKRYKGTVVIDGKKRASGAETLTFKDVNFVAEGEWQSCVETKKNTQAHNITFDGCSFTGADKKQYGIRLRHAHNIVVKNTTGTNLYELVYGNYAVTGFIAENITVTDSTNGIWMSYVNTTAELKDLDIAVDNVGVGIQNNVAGSATIENSNVSAENPIYLNQNSETADFTLTIKEENGTFESTVDGGKAIVIDNKTTEAIDVDILGGSYSSDVSEYLVDSDLKLNSNGEGMYIVVEDEKVAETLKVEIRKISETDAEIYVKSTDGNIINRLTAAGLKFYIDTFDADGNKDEEAKVTYTLTPAEDIAITADLEVADAYAFNYTGENTADFSEKEIKIATVKFEGYRDYKFGVDSTYNATKVSTTSFKDNKEITHTVAGGNLVIDAEAVIEGEIEETTRALKVNIAFNNEIKEKDEDYTDMLIKLVGSNGYEDEIAISEANIETVNGIVTAVADFGAVAVPYRYTVTVTGAGYRTATATAVVGDDATTDFTFNFWNNVKDAENADAIFDGGKEMTKNFLAGDIVKDNTINKYDLSAVVSYFGTRQAATSLNKYDLNRDGNIDSEDIAYVLVSFGE